MAFAGTNFSLSDTTQKLMKRIDDLKQEIAAWGKRIRRFSERSRRFNQNRLFQSDQKRLYKSLERPEVCGAGPGPDQADTDAFWRGLWSEPVNHSEGPWMEVVASQSASVRPMDPVTITPEDVAEADQNSDLFAMESLVEFYQQESVRQIPVYIPIHRQDDIENMISNFLEDDLQDNQAPYVVIPRGTGLNHVNGRR
ncbi:unnamed protein product [Parnassius apollo]|uniref:(apollo) hypothetical protein n=1 Tax=Parnassius apollo TaxID=110799 RepID=A0A8S3XGI5_PARAO|nr:unnamed protein product [Parnassius apollo]